MARNVPFFESLTAREKGFMDIPHLPLTGQFEMAIKKEWDMYTGLCLVGRGNMVCA